MHRMPAPTNPIREALNSIVLDTYKAFDEGKEEGAPDRWESINDLIAVHGARTVIRHAAELAIAGARGIHHGHGHTRPNIAAFLIDAVRLTDTASQPWMRQALCQERIYRQPPPGIEPWEHVAALLAMYGIALTYLAADEDHRPHIGNA